MTGPAAPAWRWAWLVLLAAGLILAHGCHAGDHDDDLVIAPLGQRTSR